MSLELWVERIDHMLDAIEQIEHATADLDQDAFITNRVVHSAVLWHFMVIGEAIKHIPEEVRDRHPDLPWKLAWANRNFLAHQYPQINLRMVWKTVRIGLPPFKRELRLLRDSASQDHG